MSSCCSVAENDACASPVCESCGQKGLAVQHETPAHLLKEPHVSELEEGVTYLFCPTPTCDVVYFSNQTEQYFHKTDLNVRVGIKETAPPIPVCYCFEYTWERIFDEIRTTGESTALAFITEKVKNGLCECEIKNPSGRCCLGEVKKTIKQLKINQAQKSEIL